MRRHASNIYFIALLFSDLINYTKEPITHWSFTEWQILVLANCNKEFLFNPTKSKEPVRERLSLSWDIKGCSGFSYNSSPFEHKRNWKGLMWHEMKISSRSQNVRLSKA